MRQSAIIRISTFFAFVFVCLIFALIGMQLLYLPLTIPGRNAPEWILNWFEVIVQIAGFPMIVSLILAVAFGVFKTERIGKHYWHFWTSRREARPA